MAHPPELVDRLRPAGAGPWTGRVWRHMFADYPPEAENTRGARWNPPGLAATYTSLTSVGVVAEADHQIALQPIPRSPL